MKRYGLLLITVLLLGHVAFAQKALKPFPQHVPYTKGCIKPNQVSQSVLDKNVSDFYVEWKARYIRSNCAARQSYVWFEAKGKKQSVSEGQGYGMIITALMAGFDADAHTTYDHLFRYYRAHISKRSHNLMSWAQDYNCKNIDGSSATDGDLDIAYSLLLAEKQWGSKGPINYLSEAKLMLADILKLEINPKTFATLLSDSIEDDESPDYYDTRASDFMPLNLKAFFSATANPRWKEIIDRNYQLFGNIQTKYSPTAGLIPDFITGVNKTPKPVKPHYLESAYDGNYYYNACRVPWRISSDYILTGDQRSKRIADRMNRFIRTATKGDPDAIHAGYLLNGQRVKGDHFPALSFIAPFAVSAMTDQSNQQWLNKLWDYLVAFKLRKFDYYDNSIKMLDLIMVSGNWWRTSPPTPE